MIFRQWTMTTYVVVDRPVIGHLTKLQRFLQEMVC